VPALQQRDGRGAVGIAQRLAPLRPRIAAIGVFGPREVAQRTMRSGVVVVVFPGRQRGASLPE
jgi:hypothetical protein